MTYVTQYGKGVAVTDRFPSVSLWNKIPLDEIIMLDRGFHFFDDFHSAGSAQASNRHSWSGPNGVRWDGFGATGVTMLAGAAVAGQMHGILELDVDATTEEAYLSIDDTYGSEYCELSTVAANKRLVGFEARVAVDSIADTAGSIKVIGLASAGAAVAGTVVDAGTSIATISFVGFRNLITDGDGMDAVYITAGTEGVYTEAAANTALNITADTYVKYGLFYDGTRLHYYIDGVEIGTGVLATVANFPDAVGLFPFLGLAQVGSGDFEMDVDWVKFARYDGHAPL